jgi:hypothetical protein
MPTSGENVKASLRKILADSDVAAVAIAVLLFWSLNSACWSLLGLLGPLSRAAEFLITAVAIHGIPYSSRTLDVTDLFTFFNTFAYLFYSLAYMAAAWLLSRWVHGVGPTPLLKQTLHQTCEEKPCLIG